MSRNVSVYGPADKAISAMNRQNVEAFGRLKMAKWDEINVIRTVVSVYHESEKRARKRYKKVAYEAYLLGWDLCRLDGQKGRKSAEKAITDKWIDSVLSETDFVTQYRFNTEAERKAYRLAETLEVTRDRNLEIDKALRYWSQQLAQYAINMTDYAMIMAYMDAGVEDVRWITQKDERVCAECSDRDEQVFKIEDIPSKHLHCRCYVVPERYRF